MGSGQLVVDGAVVLEQGLQVVAHGECPLDHGQLGGTVGPARSLHLRDRLTGLGQEGVLLGLGDDDVVAGEGQFGVVLLAGLHSTRDGLELVLEDLHHERVDVADSCLGQGLLRQAHEDRVEDVTVGLVVDFGCSVDVDVLLGHCVDSVCDWLVVCWELVPSF